MLPGECTIQLLGQIERDLMQRVGVLRQIVRIDRRRAAVPVRSIRKIRLNRSIDASNINTLTAYLVGA